MDATPIYLADLNPQQREAVTSTDGPLLVLAGAGSGKTRVITHRIVHLIHTGVSPSSILAITFTNKAAREMRERVDALIVSYPVSARAGLDGTPTVTTFHALGVRILREFHELVGVRKHFTIYDRADSVKLIKTCLKDAGYDPRQFEPRRILSAISRAKGDAIGQQEFAESATQFPARVAADVWERYDAALRREHALDFDDLLFETLTLITRYEAVRTQLQQRYRYIHIDEYQDTNTVQYKIARLLAGALMNICVVGDVDQNVYSWRGADIKNLLQFEKHFPGTRTVLLAENYRSTQTIIAASNAVIAKNTERIEKTVFTKNANGEQIALYAALSGSDEAEYVATTAHRHIKKGVAPSDIAVLFRTNFQSRALEEAFLTYNIPYQVVGTKFFDRKEVKDIVSFLRLAGNPESITDLARIANVPPRGIGKVTLLKLIEGDRTSITGTAAKKVAEFDTMMMDIARTVRERPLSEALTYIMRRSTLEVYYQKQGTEEDLARIENMRELVTLARRYDETEPETAYERFLEDAALQTDQDELGRKEEIDAVRLMTVHAAKGLEFRHVFVTGLEEGLFPHERLDVEEVDIEEERRLFYVALTRAEEKVHLSFAHVRMIFGSQRINVPSSFLDDIDPSLIAHENPDGDGRAVERTILIE